LENALGLKSPNPQFGLSEVASDGCVGNSAPKANWPEPNRPAGWDPVSKSTPTAIVASTGRKMIWKPLTFATCAPGCCDDERILKGYGPTPVGVTQSDGTPDVA